MKHNYYFDNAATTWPKPETVYQFMDSFFRSHGVNPGRSGHTLAIEAEQMIVSTRRMLAEFFGFTGDANRVVFTQNATDSLNIALSGLLSPGDHVIISQLDHNAVLRPINHMQRDKQVTVTSVEPESSGYIDPNKIESALTDKTRIIVLNHASNVIGTVQDLNTVATLAKDKGLLLVVDSAQTAGVLNIDMESGIDVLTFTGHKGLFGPMGIGGMVVAEGVEIAPTRFGGTGVDSISAFQPDAYPHRLEAGTVSIPGIAGLNAAQRWFAETGAQIASLTDVQNHAECCKQARDHIHKIEQMHADKIWQFLQEHPRIEPMGERVDQLEYVATMSFVAKNMDAMQVAEMLDADHHICLRGGLHCAPSVHQAFGTAETGGAVRVSPGYFTEDEDVDHLLHSIEQVLD